MGAGKLWDEGEITRLVQMKDIGGYTWDEIGNGLGRTADSARSMYRRISGDPNAVPRVSSGLDDANITKIDVIKMVLPTSPYPIYNKPLVMEGDAVVLPDLEAPFHDAEFVNRVLEVAQSWGIRQCIVAGDALHFDSISSWEANWTQPRDAGALTVEQEHELRSWISNLPKRYQNKGKDIIDNIGISEADRDISTELAEARKAMQSLADVFDNIDYALGNHDSRFLHALNSPMFPEDLLHLLHLPQPKWRIAPYYYTVLMSGDQKYRIEHPRSAAMNAARKLASKYHCHILMGHSHALKMEFDPSGKFWAVQLGHCVDERRLAYASQRSNNKDAHLLGAAIVRDGFLTVLHEKTDWDKTVANY